MIDLEKGTEKLDKADGFLTKLKTILKKHWGLLTLLLLGYSVYLFVVAVGEEMDNPTIEQEPYHSEEIIGEPEHDEEYVIIKKTWDIDPSGYRKGDTIYIDYYDDGYIDKYYTDGEIYYAD